MADISQIEVNGTTYDICDAIARDSLANYLPLTGGTLTGNIILKSDNIDRDGSNPSSTAYGRALTFADKDGETIGTIRPQRSTAGGETIVILARTEVNNEMVEGGIWIAMSDDGTPNYAISSPPNFRNALGASNGIFPRSLGGTGINNIGATGSSNSGTNTTAAAATTWYNRTSLSVPAGRGLVIGKLVFSTGTTTGAVYQYVTTKTLATVKSDNPTGETADDGLDFSYNPSTTNHYQTSLVIIPYDQSSATTWYQHWKSISTNTELRWSRLWYIQLAGH